MGKIKFCVILIVCFLNFNLEAQVTDVVVKAFVTLSPGKMLNNESSLFYVHGAAEFFVSPRVSFSGDGFVSIGIIDLDKNIFSQNHNLFFGVNKHFINKSHDFFIGVQPGASFTELNLANIVMISTYGVNPVISANMGYNYYVNDFFHFFVQTRFVFGNHSFGNAVNLNEFRVSGGLGFHITKANSN